ncbi:glutamine-hydrolyzing GMP synthase [Sodalis sp. CWE]|uniref:glutamine-hydrolyzing GMP synthase n=1 Tax=Sodalis sp. CWE TaxID=2803816 RepID=UPI001C7D4A94|nr:glutamine-hydrolyzing GMP synthase [Sodalis sp. CWE]MBX4181010.1 glutamine-hydrolyzing GMP synthase [Sodalis sp. CWE]
MKSNIYNGILLLDFGSQYTQLIANQIHALGVHCKLWSWNTTEIQIRNLKPRGIILSGSPESITEHSSLRVSDYIFRAGIPVLGICYGMHIIAVQLGGTVCNASKGEFGSAQVEILINSPLIRNIQDNVSSNGTPLLDVWMSHNDMVVSVPKGFSIIASTKVCPCVIMANEKKQLYGIQFHPEVTHTKQGTRIFERFIFNICKCSTFWTSVKVIDDVIIRIRKQVKNDGVILGLSGGVDSSVTAMLLHRAIGDQLTCVFIDNGLLHHDQSNQLIRTFGYRYGLKIIHILAEDRFFSALAGIIDPEEKRKSIGRVFMEIFYEQAMQLTNVKWLAQGTIYPDIIESSSIIGNRYNVIKSHHNVGGMPKNIKMGLVEPLKGLFKDEVRKIGLELGLPYEMLYCHPFPGPGFSVRVLGEVKKEYCDLLRRTDAIFIEELIKENLYSKISQAFTIFLPVRSVGIMGDIRRYDWTISLRAIETVNFMTANWAYLPYDFLNHVSNRIINEVEGISRVVYDISNKPPSTIEWE